MSRRLRRMRQRKYEQASKDIAVRFNRRFDGDINGLFVRHHSNEHYSRQSTIRKLAGVKTNRERKLEQILLQLSTLEQIRLQHS